jgi:hypothetical protein
VIEPTEKQVATFLYARITKDGVPPGFVRDEIDGSMNAETDNVFREHCGVGPISGDRRLGSDEEWEMQAAIVRAGLRAVLNMNDQ